MSDRILTANQLLPHFHRCGYDPSCLLENVALAGERMASFIGFAQRPFDTRSACFSVMDVVTTPEEEARACRIIGAPLTFLCHQDHLLWWNQTGGNPYQFDKIPANRLEGFFLSHQDDFAPKTIYRAKTLGPFDPSAQRSFVDLGLMPLVERECGQAIERLLLDNVALARQALGWPKELELKQSQWLVKSTFWLLGAKMLHDKAVDGFMRLDFGNVDEVFARVSKHYGESAEGMITSSVKRKALQLVAERIKASPNLQLATTEALAYVYENFAITKEVRAEFGTHSTPGYLVDYILGRLAPWIEQIDQDKRSVFEPACGHSAFLVAAIRQLTSLLPTHLAKPEARKKYLRARVCGYDSDDFAIEIARLSLTLADIPNSNGWMLKAADLFESDLLEKAACESNIILANPPFEDFGASQRAAYARTFREPQFLNKTTEILYRAFTAMPPGGVFGVVVPQSLLHEANAADFRKFLLEQFEMQEICLFPDRVFNFADQESAVLIGRKNIPSTDSSVNVRYRRVQERDIEGFKADYSASFEREIKQSQFSTSNDASLFVPYLNQVWAEQHHCCLFQDFVDIGKGFEHIGKTTFSVKDFTDLPSFASKLANSSDVVSSYLVSNFSARARKKIENYRSTRSAAATFHKIVVQNINAIINGPSIYNIKRFSNVDLSPTTKKLLASSSQSETGPLLNRLLLEDAYPKEISRKSKILVSDEKFDGSAKGFVEMGRELQTHQLPEIKWVNIDPAVIRRPLSGMLAGKAQILINHHPVDRGPWCIKAIQDKEGFRANRSFLIVRPIYSELPIEAYWAILNSPFANAFARSHSSKRDILGRDMLLMPVPDLKKVDLTEVVNAVRNYFEAVSIFESPLQFQLKSDGADEEEKLRTMYWRIDAEVLKLYSLPAEQERELLDFFNGWERVGVPFKQTRYFPENFDEPVSLADFLAITADWEVTNERRLELVDKKLAKTAKPEEKAELERLQHLAGLKRELHASPSNKELVKIEMDLRKRGLWRGA